ncbi:hypothetical protein J6590_029787 [Homalodisca vitripennis]|nr:hypothetical protein J6590_029787 [Homalodisca vitripennis]
MLHQYLMGLYDSECVTHGTRRASGGYCPGFSESITEAYFPKSSPRLPPRLAPQYRSYLAPLACARVVCVVYCIVHYRQAETSPAELLMLKRLRDRTARKRQTTLAQPKLTEFFTRK